MSRRLSASPTLKSDQPLPPRPSQVQAPTSYAKMQPVSGFSWNSYVEDTNSLNDGTFTKVGLSEQLSTTWDRTDYLWYTIWVDIAQNEQFLKTGQYPTVMVMSAGHAVYVYVNGRYNGMAYGSLDNPKLTYTGSAKLWAGSNKISLLSVSVGLPNGGQHYETWNAGVLGPVTLSGLNEGKRDLSVQKWTYQFDRKDKEIICAIGYRVYIIRGYARVENYLIVS